MRQNVKKEYHGTYSTIRGLELIPGPDFTELGYDIRRNGQFLEFVTGKSQALR